MPVIVSGTDTGIGKTVFCAALVGALNGVYWKPVQSGLDDETDSQVVARLSGAEILPEAYRLVLPASPHRAAAAQGVAIDPAALVLPRTSAPLVVEGAGGLLVPLTQDTLYIDVFARWAAPLILCARTGLGTINHTLLSLEALKARAIPLKGIVFIGDAVPDSEQVILRFSGARRLGRLPLLASLDKPGLQRAFAAHFNLADFA